MIFRTPMQLLGGAGVEEAGDAGCSAFSLLASLLHAFEPFLAPLSNDCSSAHFLIHLLCASFWTENYRFCPRCTSMTQQGILLLLHFNQQ